MAVHRIYVTKKAEYATEEKEVFEDLRGFLGIKSLTGLKIYNRYDVEGINSGAFDELIDSVFSEPPVDMVFSCLDHEVGVMFGVEYLPGQFDQRADSAAQCIRLVTGGLEPVVHSAKIYCLYGALTNKEIDALKSYVINPVECREASMEHPKTLIREAGKQDKTPVLDGFIDMGEGQRQAFIKEQGLAMDVLDLAFCQSYFKEKEGRNPTQTELKIIDTYWSDHCRHTTFLTSLDNITIENKAVKSAYEKYLAVRQELYKDKSRPVTLMDIATIGAKHLKKTGVLKDLDESDEINACCVKVDIDVDGKSEKWLLMFKNETHNHPTEIEPFGGAATCIGGAIRDPLSGRSYVYQAMRVTGAGNPLANLSETLPGKLPQIKICRTAAAGYSSYGNQIGLATGLVDEVYHPGYVAKRLEVGAVIGACPAENVVRQRPEAGDLVILLGGATGRDGCGGATGSSKAHDESSLLSCGAEVQKGNAPEERKIQRLFRNPDVVLLIKKCNDFGAGGVAVAIGELADGLEINLDAVPLKYEGLSGTEIAISESQERMAVVVAAENAQAFIRLAGLENLNAVIVANVTDKNRLVMFSQGEKIVDISREFLNSNGVLKHIDVKVLERDIITEAEAEYSLQDRWVSCLTGLNTCSKKGLIERFDSTIGAGTVLMPLGGRHQSTPVQAMCAKLPVYSGETNACSIMAYGFDPYLSEEDPFSGAYYAVVSSVCKMVAAGGTISKCWLSFQEYFERLMDNPVRWGKPFSALLGALEAQLALGLGAIGGKDSMSGSFGRLDVPPTLISFAVGLGKVENIISPEFKKAGSNIYLIKPEKTENGLLDKQSLISTLNQIESLIKEKVILSAYAIGFGGVCEAVSKMAFGNGIGAVIDLDTGGLFEKGYGSFLAEVSGDITIGKKIGVTTDEKAIIANGVEIDISELESRWGGVLEPVYKTTLQDGNRIPKPETISFNNNHTFSYTGPKGKPTVVIPVFPGTNCEYDTARAFEKYGAKTNIFVVKNRSARDIEESIEGFCKALGVGSILALPGGFSGGDEPDGSAKYIVSVLRNPRVAEEINRLLYERDGLILGICNGFQALVKSGLLPYGKIAGQRDNSPTLTYNTISRHQSRLVHTRISSTLSPWFMYHKVGDISLVAISHGEGRFIAEAQHIKTMAENGQIAAQYVDDSGEATNDIRFNPNGSDLAIEAITSPDGRILGKMGHSERAGIGLYKNVPYADEQLIFKGAIDYFKI